MTKRHPRHADACGLSLSQERRAPSTPILHALITPPWKYVRAYGLWDVAELYELKADPYELHNLFAESEHHVRAMQMDKRLFALLSETGGDSMPPSRLERRRERRTQRPSVIMGQVSHVDDGS